MIYYATLTFLFAGFTLELGHESRLWTLIHVDALTSSLPACKSISAFPGTALISKPFCLHPNPICRASFPSHICAAPPLSLDFHSLTQSNSETLPAYHTTALQLQAKAIITSKSDLQHSGAAISMSRSRCPLRWVAYTYLPLLPA